MCVFVCMCVCVCVCVCAIYIDRYRKKRKKERERNGEKCREIETYRVGERNMAIETSYERVQMFLCVNAWVFV